MKKTIGGLLAASLIAVVLAATTARADLTIEMKHNDTPQTIRVAEHKMAMEMDGRNVIFRGDQKTLYVVDPAEKSVMVIDSAEARALGAKVKDAMSEMKEAMKGMPPDQRAMVEKMLAGKMPKDAEVQRMIKPLGQKKTINGFSCEGYTVQTNDLTTEIWAADPRELKIDKDDLAAFKELADFMSAAVPGLDQLKDYAKDFDHPREDQVPGFPVLTIARDKEGKDLWRTELVKVEKTAVPASAFEVPSGLTRKKPLGDE